MLNWICLPLGSRRGIQLHSFCRPLRKQAGTDRCKRNNHWVEALHQPCLRPLWWTGKQQKEAWAKEDRPSFSLLPVNLARWYVVLTGERACRSNEPDTETSFMSHHAQQQVWLCETDTYLCSIYSVLQPAVHVSQGSRDYEQEASSCNTTYHAWSSSMAALLFEPMQWWKEMIETTSYQTMYLYCHMIIWTFIKYYNNVQVSGTCHDLAAYCRNQNMHR